MASSSQEIGYCITQNRVLSSAKKGEPVKIRYLLFIATLFAIIGLMVPAFYASRKRSFMIDQLTNCKQVVGCLIETENERGDYPLTYESAVAVFGRGSDDWNLFRERKGGEPMKWLYQKPDSMEQVCIVSPVPVKPWRGAKGRYIVGYANGRVETQIQGKLSKGVNRILAEKGVSVRSDLTGG